MVLSLSGCKHLEGQKENKNRAKYTNQSETLASSKLGNNVTRGPSERGRIK